MIGGEHEWMFWSAIGVAVFVCAYAAAFGDPDPPADLPLSSLDL